MCFNGRQPRHLSRRLSNLSVGRINNMSPMQGCQSRIFSYPAHCQCMSLGSQLLFPAWPQTSCSREPRYCVKVTTPSVFPTVLGPPSARPRAPPASRRRYIDISIWPASIFGPERAGRPAICPDGRWRAGGWWDQRARLARGSRSHSLLELELLPFLRVWVVAGEKTAGEAEVSVGAERQGGRQRGTKGPGQTTILAVAA